MDGVEAALSEGAEGAWGWFAGVRVQGGTGRWRMATTAGGYHCTSWLKTYSGCGCVRASQSGTASTGASSHAGGPRAGLMRGGSAGSPIAKRMRRTGAVSVMKATMRRSAPPFGQTRGLGREQACEQHGPPVVRRAAVTGCRGVKVRLKNKGKRTDETGKPRPKYEAPHREHPETDQDVISSDIHANHLVTSEKQVIR